MERDDDDYDVVAQQQPPILISNAEVLELLQKKQSNKRSRGSGFEHRDWVERRVVEYLQKTPCAKLDANRREELKSVLTEGSGGKKRRKRQLSVGIVIVDDDGGDGDNGNNDAANNNNDNDNRNNNLDGDRRKRIGFGLTEAESLQVLNFMPTELVELHLVVDQLDARMSEREQEELLETIGSYYSCLRDPNEKK